MAGQRKRFEVFKRDYFTCQYCGRKPPEVTLQCDHIIPTSKGGRDCLDNLVTSCADCNSGKSDRELSLVPESLQARMKGRRERAEQMKAYTEFLQQLRDAEDEWIKDIGFYWFNLICEERDKYVFASTAERSIRTFLNHLTPVEIINAIDVSQKIEATPSDWHRRWRYFCGVCWSMVRARRSGGHG